MKILNLKNSGRCLHGFPLTFYCDCHFTFSKCTQYKIGGHLENCHSQFKETCGQEYPTNLDKSTY